MNVEISLKLSWNSKCKIYLSHRRFTYPPTDYPLGWNDALLNVLAFAQLTLTHAPASLQLCLDFPPLCSPVVWPISSCNLHASHTTVRWREKAVGMAGFWTCHLSPYHIMPTWCIASPVYGRSAQAALMILKIAIMVSYMKLHSTPGNGERICPSWGLSPSPYLLCLHTSSTSTSLQRMEGKSMCLTLTW